MKKMKISELRRAGIDARMIGFRPAQQKIDPDKIKSKEGFKSLQEESRKFQESSKKVYKFKKVQESSKNIKKFQYSSKMF